RIQRWARPPYAAPERPPRGYGETVTVSVRANVAPTSSGPTVGLAAQFVLLAGLASGVGLGPAGWLIGMTFGLVTCGVLARALYRAGMRTLGAANAVTLARATLVGGVAAL